MMPSFTVQLILMLSFSTCVVLQIFTVVRQDEKLDAWFKKMLLCTPGYLHTKRATEGSEIEIGLVANWWWCLLGWLLVLLSSSCSPLPAGLLGAGSVAAAPVAVVIASSINWHKKQMMNIRSTARATTNQELQIDGNSGDKKNSGSVTNSGNWIQVQLTQQQW